jgi:hypothetical protein
VTETRDGFDGNMIPIKWVHHACEGVIAGYDEHAANQAGRAREVALIEVLAASLPAGVTPLRQDHIIFGAEWYLVTEVSRDPAQTIWTLRAVLDDPPL